MSIEFYIIAAICLGFVAYGMYLEHKINVAFEEGFSTECSKGYYAEDVAGYLLQYSELTDIEVEVTDRHPTDCYIPRKRKIRLSEDTAYSNSIGAIALAAHEVGHAMQRAEGSGSIKIRNWLTAVTGFQCRVSLIVILLGFIISFTPFIALGLIFYLAGFIYHIANLSLEVDASNRAMALLTEYDLIDESEEDAVRDVLKAAETTYVLAALAFLMHILRFVLQILASSKKSD